MKVVAKEKGYYSVERHVFEGIQEVHTQQDGVYFTAQDGTHYKCLFEKFDWVDIDRENK